MRGLEDKTLNQTPNFSFSHVLYPQIYQKKKALKKRLTWWFFYSAGILLHCHTSYLLIPVCMHELTIRKYLLVDIYV